MNNNDSIASSDHQRQLHLQSVKSRRHNYREVTSRYLTPNATGNPSPNSSVSPVRHSRKLRISFDDTTTNKGGLWPASVASNSSTGSKQVEQTTLAEHLGNLRLKDLLDESQNVSQFLNRQKSCSESISRFESRSSKENYKPVFKSSSSNFKSVEPSGILPGRFSVDENALNRSRKSSSFISDRLESESDQFSYKCASNDSQSSAAGVRKTASFSSYMSSTATSRRNGIHVSSKFMQDSNSTTNRLSDASVSKPVSLEDSPKLHNSILKSAMRRANSLTGYGSVTSQWALSPGRSNSNKGKLLKTYSNLKPPTSPQKSANGVEKLLNMGKDLFKTKKSSTTEVLYSAASGSANAEGVHQLRLLHCRLMQWRFTNVKAETACVNVTRQAEMNLIVVQESIVRLQHSVTRRRLKFQRESLVWKLNVILHSQMKLLESWGEIERQHTSAVSKTKDSLLAAVCKVPLIEGAEVDTQLASLTLRHASDLTASMKSILTKFSPLAGETCMLLSELAEVVAHENFHIQECLEMCKTISVLEVQERSLKSNLIQLVSSQQQFMEQKQPECII